MATLTATPVKTATQAAATHTASHVHHSPLPHWLTQLGGVGLFTVAAIDSSPIPLAIPGSTDLLLLLLVSRHGNPVLLAACAIAGSAVGGYLTWSAGKKGGEALLKHSVPARYRARIERWTNEHSVLSVMLPPLMPPPIPLTPFLLAAGALGVSRRRFLVAFNIGRSVRYALVAWAGVVSGRTVVRWWTNTLAGYSSAIGWTFALLLTGGTLVGIWQYRRQKQAALNDRAPAAAVPAN
jgi:membrane protein YqaA with SNARE-associated domain